MIWRIELGSCQETNQQVTNFITNKQWSIARVMALWDNAIISIMNPFGLQQFPKTSIFLHDSFEMNWNYCKNFITIPFQSPCQYSLNVLPSQNGYWFDYTPCKGEMYIFPYATLRVTIKHILFQSSAAILPSVFPFKIQCTDAIKTCRQLCFKSHSKW